MDVLLTANQSPSRYYIASTPFADAATAPFDNTTATAILQYKGTYKPHHPFPSQRFQVTITKLLQKALQSA